jgi:hypothetical protein
VRNWTPIQIFNLFKTVLFNPNAVGYITFKTNRPMETFVKNEIVGACNTYVGEERGIQGFGGEV